MEEMDCRWKQRLASYRKALAQLRDAVALSGRRQLPQLEQQGLIQAFEFTQELAWSVMKDFLVYQGIVAITGSRDAIRAAFKAGLIEDGETWMETIASRNRSSHTYEQGTADEIAELVKAKYMPLFEAFAKKMGERESEEP